MVLTGKSDNEAVFNISLPFALIALATLPMCRSLRFQLAARLWQRLHSICTETIVKFSCYCSSCLFSGNRISGWNEILSQPFCMLYLFFPTCLSCFASFAHETEQAVFQVALPRQCSAIYDTWRALAALVQRTG